MTSSILGCGWLGFPLAEKMIEAGFTVNGSTTTEAKLSTFAAAGIQPFLLDVSDTENPDWRTFLSSEVIVIAIPPKENYSENIRKLMPYFDGRKVMLISSTSVYGSVGGTLTEESPLLPDTASAKEMVAAENLVISLRNVTIVRFGGLIGPDRHPVKYLSGRDNISNPGAPVNLIRLQDAIALIMAIIERGAWNQIFNGVYPAHPTREDFYTNAADTLGIARPRFREHGGAGKIVSSEKAAHELAFEFRCKP